MRRSLVPCLDCGMPSKSSRCTNCAEKRLDLIASNPKANTTQRGYGSDWQRVRMLILNRDKWICYICGKKLVNSDATVDHIVSIADDPSLRLTPSNLAACCRACNSRKAGRK